MHKEALVYSPEGFPCTGSPTGQDAGGREGDGRGERSGGLPAGLFLVGAGPAPFPALLSNAERPTGGSRLWHQNPLTLLSTGA